MTEWNKNTSIIKIFHMHKYPKKILHKCIIYKKREKKEKLQKT